MNPELSVINPDPADRSSVLETQSGVQSTQSLKLKFTVKTPHFYCRRLLFNAGLHS